MRVQLYTHMVRVRGVSVVPVTLILCSRVQKPKASGAHNPEQELQRKTLQPPGHNINPFAVCQLPNHSILCSKKKKKYKRVRKKMNESANPLNVSIRIQCLFS